jgi:hypothetical protein
MSWSEKYKKSIDCDNPKGFSQRAHCQGRKKKLDEEGLRDWFGKSKSKDGKKGWVNVVTGDSCASDKPGEGIPKCVSSAKRASMSKKERLAAQRAKRSEDPGQQDKSGASKPTMVKTDRKVRKEEMELCPICGYDPCQCLEGTVTEAKDKPGKGSGKKDACYNKVKSRYSVWPSAYASGALVKCRKVGAANWGTKSEETINERGDFWHPDPEKDRRLGGPGPNQRAREDGPSSSPQRKPDYSNRLKPGETYMQFAKRKKAERTRKEEKDHEYSMARSEISTVIAAAKRLKKKVGKGEGNLEAWVQSKITKAADYLDTAADYVDSGEHNESVKIEDANGKTFAEVIDIIGPNQFKPVVEAKKSGDPCWVGYKQVGMKKKGGKMVPNCVKESFTIDKDAHNKLKRREKIRTLANVGVGGERDVAKSKLGKTAELPSVKKEEKTFNQFMEDWQKVNKSDKTDGMSQKAVDTYRRENPGSKLKTAVTGDPKPGSKDAKRRKSFCSRSKGQQDMHNIDCSKTPDKAICKARRRWKC